MTLEWESDVVQAGWSISVAREASNSQSDVVPAGLVATALKGGAGLARHGAKPGAATPRASATHCELQTAAIGESSA